MILVTYVIFIKCLLCSISDKLELIEAGKAGPVGSKREDVSSPKQPIIEEKKDFLATDVDILENGMGLEQELPEINFQV